jgi:hypothetical protein
MYAFVFMSQLSAPFWRHISYLRFIQFPWRFGVLPPLAAAVLSALSFAYLKERRPRAALTMLIVFGIGWMVVTVWTAGAAIPALAGRASSLETAIGMEVKLRPGPCEYLPLAASVAETCSDKASERVQMLQDLLAGHAAKSAFFGDGSAHQIGGAAAVIDWKPRNVILEVDAPGAEPLTLRYFYYAGWVARDRDTGKAIPLGPSTPDAFMQLSVPQGKHQIVIELPTQPTEKAGRMISLLSLAGLAAILFYLKLRAPLPAPRD